MRKIGFQAERGIEQYVLGRAQRAGKEIVGLETLEFQIGIFDALPPESAAGDARADAGASSTKPPRRLSEMVARGATASSKA